MALLQIVSSVCSLLALSSSGLLGTHLLPAWMQASLMHIRGVDEELHLAEDDAASDALHVSSPEEPLLKQLAQVDSQQDPEGAYALHSAIANMLQASGTKHQQALHHFEAAREAATRGKDPDALLSARIQLSEAYIDEGRARDSQRELIAASGILANHFTENVAKLNRGHGRARFELGFTKSAVGFFEQAEKTAVQPEDKVNIACDLALARACLGDAGQSLEPLQEALVALREAKMAGQGEGDGMPAAVHDALAAAVHFRLAELFHSKADWSLAKEHYIRSLNFHRKLTSPRLDLGAAINKGMAKLEKRKGPEFRCPSLPRPPWEKSAPQSMQDSEVMEKITSLLAEGRYDQAESELKSVLATHRTEGPYTSFDAAIALNMLGKLYQDQNNFPNAAKHFRQALHAVTACCGATDKQATLAYEGLTAVKEKLEYGDQRVAAAAISRYFDLLEKAGVTAGSRVEREDIINLLTYSEPLVIA